MYPQHSCHVDGFAFYNNVNEYFLKMLLQHKT